MLEVREFLCRAHVDVSELDAWVEAGWLRPNRASQALEFSEADVARGRLIHDLQRDLGVNEDGISIVLDLVDQLHGMRRTMRDLMTALRAQPEAARHRLAADVYERDRERDEKDETPR